MTRRAVRALAPAATLWMATCWPFACGKAMAAGIEPPDAAGKVGAAGAAGAEGAEGAEGGAGAADTAASAAAATSAAAAAPQTTDVTNAADPTDAALKLADATPDTPVQTARPWKLAIEEALRASGSRDGTHSARNQLSVDFQYAQALGSAFVVNFAARYDRFDPMSAQAESHRDVPLVKEGYVSWRLSSLQQLDVGRINARIGAGIGYNPTDFFGAGAITADVRPDPDSRRTNRLGSVAVRAQQLWDTGSLSLTYSPRLASRSLPGNPNASSDLQRTNGVERWELLGSQRLGASVQPQWLIYGQQGQAPQFGQNLSVLLGNSVVAYAEWTGGRRRSLIGRANGIDDTAFRTSSSIGATWTLPVDLSLTAELQSNAAGASAAQWRSLAAANPAAWGNAVQTAVTSQELPARHALFVMAMWRNLGMRGLDLSAFVQADAGGGRQYWGELRRRFQHFDVALQVQTQAGPAWSRFGAMSEARSVQMLASFYR
ncbi:hypothetical protein LJ656_22910 [Paraburkholderia sp. MMS20-SJTR3]|uniref:Uncharacterized protein n=1 Tax=Paraburkholderia sejongensis TaxID=2886946 RepID=A0ABS8JZV5_9BURK|nr:hypothetical protein [Paraburkholderia sp. MMS20-SJTR3]MCC8395442.1 hypothetical protein [Paraburkholderia sp. MMS20-SJTR3]